MMKWIKKTKGDYFNMDDITTIEWKKNGSAIGASFDLKCENTTGIHILSTCDSEENRPIITEKLEHFLNNDEHLLIIPKL